MFAGETGFAERRGVGDPFIDGPCLGPLPEAVLRPLPPLALLPKLLRVFSLGAHLMQPDRLPALVQDRHTILGLPRLLRE